MQLIDLVYCMKGVKEEENGGRGIYQEVTFDWLGKTWKLCSGAYGHHQACHDFYFILDGKVIEPDLDASIQTLYKDFKPVKLEWVDGAYAFYGMIIMFLKLGMIVSDKVVFKEVQVNETKAAYKSGILYFYIKKGDRHYIYELVESIKHSEKSKESLNTFWEETKKLLGSEIQIHSDCNKLLPRELYDLEDYTFEDFIESGDYLEVYGEETDAQKYDKEVKRYQGHLISVLETDKVYKQYDSEIEKLWNVYHSCIVDAFENVLGESEERTEVQKVCDKLYPDYDYCFTDFVETFIPDFEKKLYKVFEKRYTKNPFECSTDYKRDNGIQFIDWFESSKYLERFVEDCLDDIEVICRHSVEDGAEKLSWAKAEKEHWSDRCNWWRYENDNEDEDDN